MVCGSPGAQSDSEVAHPPLPSLSFRSFYPRELGAHSFPELLYFATHLFVDNLRRTCLAHCDRSRLWHDRRSREEFNRSKSRICTLLVHMRLACINRGQTTPFRNCYRFGASFSDVPRQHHFRRTGTNVDRLYHLSSGNVCVLALSKQDATILVHGTADCDRDRLVWFELFARTRPAHCNRI